MCVPDVNSDGDDRDEVPLLIQETKPPAADLTGISFDTLTQKWQYATLIEQFKYGLCLSLPLTALFLFL